MLSVTKLSSFTHFLVSICLCFHKCFSVIEEDKFAFMKSIPMNEDGSVYLTFPVPDKRNLILTCSATCVTEVDCIGIDVCNGRICRLWNLTFSPSLPLNNSNVFCQRYIKVSTLSKFLELTSNALDTSSNQAPTSLTNDQSSIYDRTMQTMSFETESVSSEVTSTNVTSTVSNVANVDLTSNDYHTAAMLSSPDQTTITSEKSGTTDSATTKVMTIETSSSTDISATDAMTTETSRSTHSTTEDPMTTETTGSTNSTTTDVFTTEISSQTDSTTTDVITTGMSSPTDSSATDVVTTETSRATDSITTEVVTTKASSLTDSTTTDLMTTEISSLTHSSTTNVMTTETSSPSDSTITEVMSTVTLDSTATDTITAETLGPADSTATNALISVPIESTTSNALLTATNTILQTTAETPTAFDNTTSAVPTSSIVNISDTSTPDGQATTLPSIYIDSTTIMSTTERLDETCIMTYGFSGGTHEVPCYNDTYSWIVIQRRFDGSIDFYRNWNEYKLGFGFINTEFWLGNDNLHELTSVFGYTHLRIEIKDFDGLEGYAEYTFSIDDESSLYMIHVSWISGNITDKLWLTDGASFCTYDQDNDGSKSKVCTTDFHGGWWYAWSAFCTEANPNGIYYHTYTPEKTGIFWFGFGSSSYHTLKEVRMMIRKP